MKNFVLLCILGSVWCCSASSTDSLATIAAEFEQVAAEREQIASTLERAIELHELAQIITQLKVLKIDDRNPTADEPSTELLERAGYFLLQKIKQEDTASLLILLQLLPTTYLKATIEPRCPFSVEFFYTSLIKCNLEIIKRCLEIFNDEWRAFTKDNLFPLQYIVANLDNYSYELILPVIQLLIYEGADQKQCYEHDETLLHRSVRIGKPELFTVILSANPFAVNYVDEDEQSVLHIAASRGDGFGCWVTSELLKNRWLNPLLQDIEQRTALDIAETTNHVPSIDLLRGITTLPVEPTTPSSPIVTTTAPSIDDMYARFEDEFLARIKQNVVLSKSLTERLDAMHMSFDALKDKIKVIERGEDTNIATIQEQYGENCKKFYIAFRNALYGYAKYLLIYVNTGYLDTPLGEAGGRIDSIEHWIDLGISVLGVASVPIISDGADVILSEGLYRGAEFARSSLGRQIDANLNRMYGLFSSQADPLKRFCQEVSLTVVRQMSEQINTLSSAQNIESLAKRCTTRALHTCVDKDRELERLLAEARAERTTDSLSLSFWEKFKNTLRVSFWEKFSSSLPKLFTPSREVDSDTDTPTPQSLLSPASTISTPVLDLEQLPDITVDFKGALIYTTLGVIIE